MMNPFPYKRPHLPAALLFCRGTATAIALFGAMACAGPEDTVSTDGASRVSTTSATAADQLLGPNEEGVANKERVPDEEALSNWNSTVCTCVGGGITWSYVTDPLADTSLPRCNTDRDGLDCSGILSGVLGSHVHQRCPGGRGTCLDKWADDRSAAYAF